MNNRLKKGLSELKSLFLLILIILTIKVTIFEMYIVPTGSMENTIMTGDFLVGNRFVYGMRTPDRIGLMDFSTNLPSLKFPSFKEPKRGDVIIFKFPRDTRQKYVKRCVAEPGDVLEIKDIKLEFVVKSGFLSKHETVKVLNGIDLSVSRGTTVALVGESGCGKTTLGRTILGLYKHSKGSVIYRDLFEKTYSILNCTKLELKKLRKELRMIFQDPFSSLNPRLPVFDIIGEPLLMNKTVKRSELQDKIEKALIQVNLPRKFRVRVMENLLLDF